jgi:hypothetical protein
VADRAFRGEPDPFELALGRGLRLLQVLIAGPLTLTLWWFEAWYWLPIPIATSFLVYEALYAGRRDQPTTLTLADDGLRLADPRRGQALELRWDQVDVATVSWRGDEGVVLLADPGGPRVALRLVGEARPGDVDLPSVDRELGGTGDRLPAAHAVAPIEAIARQRFTDPELLRILRDRVPAAAWGRAGARTWVGEAPPMDAFGYLQGEPTGWLRLDGDRWSLRRPGSAEVLAEGPLEPVSVATRTRPASLRLAPSAPPVEVEIRLVVLRLPDGPRVAMPAGAPDGGELPEADPAPDDHHTHFPEGAALVAYARRPGSAAAGWAERPRADTGDGPTRVQGSS